MVEARRLVEAGVYPAHHLWGTQDLEAAGLSVEPIVAGPSCVRLTNATRRKLGDIGVERAMFGRRSASTVCFAADSASLGGLGLLRRIGLGAPVAAVIHPRVVPIRFLRRAVLRSYDLVFTPSARIGSDLVALGRSPEMTVILPWGPDLRFPGYQSTGDEVVVSAGKMRRDVDTLAEALVGTGIAARVYSGRRPHTRGDISFAAAESFADVLGDLQRASIVAIPLQDTSQLGGLTELNDALALSKPIVMTRNPFIDVDIEAIGCGIWIDHGDIAGWRQAIVHLASDAGLRSEMGRRGRAFAETQWNAELFGAGVFMALQKLMNR